jgi:hypothetical protein
MDNHASNESSAQKRSSQSRRALLKTVAAGAAGGMFAGLVRNDMVAAMPDAAPESRNVQRLVQESGPGTPVAESTSRIRYTKIVDTAMALPDRTELFADFVAGESAGPSISGGNIVFHGADAVGADTAGSKGIYAGVYTSIDGKLSTVADTETPIPGGFGTFTGFSAATISSDSVAFLAFGANGQSGVYTTLGGKLKTVADTNSRELGVARELSFTLVSPIEMTIPGRSNTFVGDRVVILGENAELQPWSQTRIEMFGANTGPLQIVRMSTVPERSRTAGNACASDQFQRTACLFDGFQNGPIGAATLSVERLPGTANREMLRVDNIGESLSDGVAQDVPNTMEMETALLTPNFSLSKDGTTLVTTQVGIVGGKPDQLFSKLTITNEAGELKVVGDWSPIGTTSYEIQIYNGSRLVTSQTGLRSGELRILGTPDLQTMRCHIWIIIITSFFYAFDVSDSASAPLLSFCATDNAGQVREYSCDGLDNIIPVANEASLVPDGKGRFTSFDFFSSVRDGIVAFTGFGSAGQLGIYTDVGGKTAVVVDSNTAIPDGEGNFTGFASMSIDDDGSVGFTGYGSNDQVGVYANVGGRVQVVADTHTPIPDGKGNFTNFGSFFGPSYSGGRLAFTGLGEAGQAGIYLRDGDTLSTVVNNSMTLDGKSFSDYAVYMSPKGFDGKQLAFQVLFNDQSQAIYVANIEG